MFIFFLSNIASLDIIDTLFKVNIVFLIHSRNSSTISIEGKYYMMYIRGTIDYMHKYIEYAGT